MTTTVTNPVAGPYIPNGVTTTFPFAFKIMSATEIVAVSGNGAPAPVGSFSVTISPGGEGGSVIFAVAPAETVGQFYLLSDPLFGQPSDQGVTQTFNPASLNNPIDRLAVQNIALKNAVDRAPQKPIIATDYVGLFPTIDAFGNWDFTPSGPGAAGPADAFRVTLASLKAASITDRKSDFDRSTWYWTTGNFTGKADDVTIVKADSAALSVGAWVRAPGSTIGLFSAFGRYAPPPTAKIVRTSGWSVDGVGAADYVRDTVQTASTVGGDNVWRRQDAFGVWWTLRKEQTIYDTMFGAIHDAQYNDAAPWYAKWTGTDCSTAVQKMMDWAIYNDGVQNVRGAAGFGLLGKMIHIGYGNAFHSINFTGAGKAYFGVNGGTMWVRNFAEPAFNVAGARNCLIERMSFCGVHRAWINGNRLANIDYAPTVDDTVSANWHDPAVATALGRSPDDRYAPDCAVVVDAFAGLTKPATFYTDPNYPAWGNPIGSNGGYGLAGDTRYYSSCVHLDEVGFIGEQSGVVTQPSGADGNGDFVHVTNWSANHCKRIISLSQTQARSSKLDYGAGGSLFEIFTTNTHGKKKGQVVSGMSHVSTSGQIRIMSVTGFSDTGSIGMEHSYFEALHSIGVCDGSASTESTLALENGTFNFDMIGAMGRPIPATVWGPTAGGAPLSNLIAFSGGAISKFPGFLSFQGGVSFRNQVSIDGQLGGAFTGTIPSWLAAAYNVTSGGVVVGQMRTGGSRAIEWSSAFNPRTIDSGTLELGPIPVREHWKYSSRARCIPWAASTFEQANNNSARRFVNPRYIEQISKSDITLISTTPGATSIEIQCSKTYPKWQAEMRGGARGDVMIDSETGIAFAVKDATWSGTTVTWTLVAYNGMKLVAGVMQFLTAFSITSGSFQAINARRYTPQNPTLGTFTDASPNVTAVGDDQASALATGQIVVGDRLYVDPPTDNWISETSSDVTVIDLTAKTLSLSGNVNTGKGGRRAITLLSRTI